MEETSIAYWTENEILCKKASVGPNLTMTDYERTMLVCNYHLSLTDGQF